MSHATSFLKIEEFIQDINAVGSLDEARTVLRRHIERFGFERFTFWLLSSSEGIKTPFHLTTYPSEWIRYYIERRFLSHDIISEHSKLAFQPFTWAFLKKRYDLTTVQMAVFQDASEIRLKTGASIPVHGPNNERSCFSVTNDCSESEFQKSFLSCQHEMHLIAIYAHEKIVRLVRASSTEPSVRLTARELEVLTWSAKGKSRWEIGEILHISEETVKKHLSNASKQLQTKNKAQAVAVALLKGIIHP